MLYTRWKVIYIYTVGFEVRVIEYRKNILTGKSIFKDTKVGNVANIATKNTAVSDISSAIGLTKGN